MSPWQKGADVVEEFLEVRRLQRLTGVELNAEPLLDRAVQQLRSAAEILDNDPVSAYILAYDAARRACTALLALQGMLSAADFADVREASRALQDARDICDRAQSIVVAGALTSF